MIKEVFIDLCNLRFGYWVKKEPESNTDNQYIITYRPFDMPFGTRKIYHIKEKALLEVKNSDVGGIGDAEYYYILTSNEEGKSPFINKFLKMAFGQMVDEQEQMRQRLSIREGLEASRDFDLSRDALSTLSKYEKLHRKLERMSSKGKKDKKL